MRGNAATAGDCNWAGAGLITMGHI